MDAMPSPLEDPAAPFDGVSANSPVVRPLEPDDPGSDPPPLSQASLAYESDAFLDSSEGRPLRILAEYSEPMARFREQRIEDTVVFFGSARFRSMQ